MAIYHFTLKHGSRADNQSAGAHARYILRTEKYEYGAHQLTHSESGNMPSWASSGSDFWGAADEFERGNARLYSEFEIALPRELSESQRLKLVKDFVNAELGDRHPYTFAIHEVEAMDGGTNPHVHVMFTQRSLDGIERPREIFFNRANSRNPKQGGAKKDRGWIEKDKLLSLRESWQDHCNLALRRAGCDAQIDRRSLTDQGLERQPEPKLSPYEAMLWRQGVITERIADILLLREIAKIDESRRATEQHLTQVEQIIELTTFEERVEGVLLEQKKLLESSLSERDSVDRKIEQLSDKLFYAPGSMVDAYEMARDRIYGSALNAHTDKIAALRASRNEIAREMETHGVGGALRDIPHTIQDLKSLWEAQDVLNEAKEAYRLFLKDMQSPEAKRECEQFGKELYEAKERAEEERNHLLTEAFEIREEISNHRYVIEETRGMLATVQDELREAYYGLPEFIMDFIEPRRSISVQAEVGQAVATTVGQMHSDKERSLKLNLAMKLELDDDF
ncbi:MAG: MobA/MobL family protein [Leptolyngbya sp. SIO3F4]|nr:MobA/MobL family protein [Leptolyngbya sp. SIO3F4]